MMTHNKLISRTDVAVVVVVAAAAAENTLRAENIVDNTAAAGTAVVGVVDPDMP